MEAASNLIKELGRLIGLEALSLDELGQCTLAFDESIVLTFVGDPDGGLNVVSFLGEVKATQPGVASMLLSRNFVPSDMGGARVALEPESSRAVLVHRWDAARCDFGQFQLQLEAFVNAVEALRAEMDALPATGPLAAATAARADMPPPGSYI